MTSEPSGGSLRPAVAAWLGVPDAALADVDAGLVDAIRRRMQEAEVAHLEEDLVGYLRDSVDRLRDEVVRDPLTGTLNRRGLEERLLLAARMCADGQPLTVMVVDIDGLKKVNDEHGHPSGDALISAVAERLGASVRRTDAVARVGGDEFVVVCPGVDEARAAVLAANLKKLVENTPAPTPAGLVEGTVSVGWAVARSADEARGVVDVADRRLYQAKRRRRDRVGELDSPGS